MASCTSIAGLAGNLTLNQTLFQPLDGVAERCAGFRQCPVMSDTDWLRLGVTRALHDLPSGRGFLQQVGGQLPTCPQKGHFFEELKSSRRLALCVQANAAVAALLQDDAFADQAELAGFDLYAADGHWHGAGVASLGYRKSLRHAQEQARRDPCLGQ